MSSELELCTVSAAIGAVLGGSVGYVITHRFDAAKIAQERQAHASDMAKINATAAQQLADALAKQQITEGRIITIQNQFDSEVAKREKDALDYRAKLRAGTERVRVKLAASCGNSSTGTKSSTTSTAVNDTSTYGFLSSTTAESAFAVVDSADQTAEKLRALQKYVVTLQDTGYINK